MKKNKAFTLIELIAVLVILAILALIVTPLVMNIIRKARISADKRSIDAYGRSIEIAIAGYLLDNGTFPTSIGQLTIEYSGDEVICSTTQLNSDSSVYLTGCTVAGRTVDYSYGTDKTPPAPTYTAYSAGDEVLYNNVNYYVITDSDENAANVTLLKAEPLTVDEVNQYGGVGTENNHVNRYTLYSGAGTAFNTGGYGGIAYYSSETCGYVNGNWVETGCKTDYNQSDIKYVIDAWKDDQAPFATEARLITVDELINNFGYELASYNVSDEKWVITESTPSWVYKKKYWTMSTIDDSTSTIWVVDLNGEFIGANVYTDVYYDYGGAYVARPVIVLPKSALSN